MQETIDPVNSQGQGIGIAPIGHVVTVVSVENVTVNIHVDLQYNESYNWDSVSDEVTEAIEVYFLEMRKTWAIQDYLTVRVSQIETRLLKITGILDVSGTTINGSTDNLTLAYNQVPVLGGISS